MHTRKKEKESKLRLRNLSPSFRAASFVLPWALPQFLPILLFSRLNFFIFFIFAVDPLRGRSGDRVEPLLCVYARRPQFPGSRATRHRRRRFPNKWRHRPLIQSLPGADKVKGVCSKQASLSVGERNDGEEEESGAREEENTPERRVHGATGSSYAGKRRGRRSSRSGCLLPEPPFSLRATPLALPANGGDIGVSFQRLFGRIMLARQCGRRIM